MKPSRLANAEANNLTPFTSAITAAVVAVLSAVNGDKISFLAVCGKDAVKAGVKAGELVKLVCTTCGGSGGGKPDSAMGGGKDASKIDEALAKVEGFVASKVQ